MSKKKNINNVAHAAYLAALAAGMRPPRASTIPDGRKAVNRRACRDRRLWD